MKKRSGTTRSKTTKSHVRRKAKKSRPKTAVKRRLRGHLVSREELAKLQDSLREAQETLDAIRSGEVDAVVVSGVNGNQIYSMAGAEQPYRVYVEQMQEGAVTVSGDGMILYCNQRFAEMVKRPLEKVISSSLTEFLTGDAWAEIAAVFGAGQDVIKHVSTLQREANEPLPVTLTASPLPVDQQQMMCLVVTDLTTQQERESYRLAKELAEKASAAKDSFLAALSHELRTPLTPTLMAASELEQNPALPTGVRQQLAMIRRNIELEARLIDDLLDLTRIARGKLELRLALTDLSTVIAGAISICQSEIDEKQIKFRYDPPATHTAVEVDTVRLQQAVWNLLRNAVKFTPRGGTVEVRTGNRGTHVYVEVTDSGMGFDPEVAPKLFLAFEQGGQQITRKFGGLGLGLAITRSILEAHGGTVTGESAGSGKGATFTLLLPASHSAMPGDVSEPSTSRIAQGRPLRLLLVEDHKDTRTALELILKRSKHHVRTATSAQEALRLAGHEPFDLVISDLGLPDQSGLEMMKQLRDKFGLKGIAVSGYGMNDDVERSREAGFFHHLTKPISMVGLRKVVADFASQIQTSPPSS
jgi:signal transduction histidine kinase/CheY-like chemotaxis protein